MKKILVVSLVIVVALAGWQGWKIWKRSLRHSKDITVASFAPCNGQIRQKEVPQQIQDILKQPFTYLAKGRQAYAFLSLDGKYVLKLFQQKRLSAENYLMDMPDMFLIKKLRKQKAKAKALRSQKLMQSQEIAVIDLSQETGVIFTHLESCGLPGEVTLLDRRGKLLHVPLDKVKFSLQHKVEPLKKTLVALMYQGRVSEAKKRIHAIFDLLENCKQKGIWDRDSALIRNNNIGFFGDRAMYIDTGKLSLCDDAQEISYASYDIMRLKPLHRWLKNYYPALLKTFEDRAQRYCENSAKILG